MKELEKCKKTSHHRPQCAKWFLRYSISKSGIWARWTQIPDFHIAQIPDFEMEHLENHLAH